MSLTESDARGIVDRALALASADEVRVNVDAGRRGNTRFAQNSITTCGDTDDLEVSVTATFGSRHATATGNEADPASLERLVARAEELARVAPEDPEHVPELGPQDYLDIDPYAPATAAITPELGVDVARSAIDPAVEKGLTTSGYFEHADRFHAVGTSAGLFATSRSTDASYSCTARTPTGGGSGWAQDNARDIDAIDYAAASRRAIAKAEASRDPVALEPGVYPVILEPAAVSDFLGYAIWSMAARSADEGRSFFSKTGGGNKMGERVVGENITLRSDPADARILGMPFAGDGLPAKPHTWIENGVLTQLAYDRFWAQKQGVEPTGRPGSLVLEGGQDSLDDLIASTDKAVLVTRFWYIRSLDPQTILVTGLTRDGVFWVEDGAIRHSLKNFRFNESPISVLNKVTGLSSPVRTGSSLTPALRAAEFTFSSLSDAV